MVVPHNMILLLIIRLFGTILCVNYVKSQHFVGVEWESDDFMKSRVGYSRMFQDPGNPCQPSPCGDNTKCMSNRQGNPICECQARYIPAPNPIDGCTLPEEFPRSPVLLQNRLGSNYYGRTPQQTPVNPCQPTPCGPNTECTVNNDGNAICRCVSSFVPNPDTITGCRPECSGDHDCRVGYVCRNNRCVLKPDPCSPSPCGQGANCMKNHAGNAICRCDAGLIPKPDTITGCGPECIRDPDCSSGLVCINQHCQQKPDPCDPNPCGPGANCMKNAAGNAICRCQEGLVPKPDTITGCGPECIRDPDCNSGFVCQQQRCVEKPDPCDPSPCGPGTTCRVNSLGNAICTCQPGLVPKPDTITGCGPECVRDPDCQYGFVCQQQRCVEKPDPCDPSPCGPGTTCRVNSLGNAICTCQAGLIPKPDTITGCGPECVRDPDCKQVNFICSNQRCIERPDPCVPSPCGPNTMCMNHNGNPICRCLAGFIPKPDTITGCDRECTIDPECQSGFICSNYQCVERPDPCDPSPCGPNTECMVSKFKNPICRCLIGFIPKPDTITGCDRECHVDQDCQRGYICQNFQCIEKPDPCDPSPCGRNTLCNVNRQGNPVCTCVPGFIPHPDTITGCKKIIVPRTPPPDPCDPSPCGQNTNCRVSSAGHAVCHCLPTYIPMPDTIAGCVNPCIPNPCGHGAECRPGTSGAICSCPAGFLGDPYTLCRRGECEHDDDCASHLACFNYHCRDPCINSCGQNAECVVRHHQPICSCPVGFIGDPLTSCTKKIVIGGRYPAQQRQPPPSRPVIGQQYDKTESEIIVERSGHVIGHTGGGGVVTAAGGRGRTTIGQNYGNYGSAGRSIPHRSSSSRSRASPSQSIVVIGHGTGRRKRQLTLRNALNLK